MLNEIDEALTKANISAKVCFAAYLDLLWLPICENIKNKDRFIMMFCPIGRDYLSSYTDITEIPDEEPYVLNKMEVPSKVECNIGFFKRMYAHTGVETFSFEYYYWRGGAEHYDDFGGIDLAKTIYNDLTVSGSYGLKGMVSCQTQRSFMPTGLGNFIMGRKLWDDKIPYEEIEKEYFGYSFGTYADKVINYLTELSALSKGDLKLVKAKSEEMLKYLNTVDTSDMTECRERSVFYLIFHVNKLIRYVDAMEKTAECGIDGAEGEWAEFLRYVRENELAVQTVFDLYLYLDFVATKYDGLKDRLLK